MRGKRILEELYHSDSYLSLNYFANLLNVSTRTVSNDIKITKKDGIKNGFDIKLKRSRGYYLNITNKKLLETYLKDIVYADKISPDYRIDCIIALLLTKENYITMDYLSEKINVSKSIIKLDINKVQEILNEENIKLERKAHYGIRIMCDEFTRKKFIARCYIEGNILIKKFINENIDSSKFDILEHCIKSILKEFKLETIYVQLEEIFSFIKTNIVLNSNESIECTSINLDPVYSSAVLKITEEIKNLFNISITSGSMINIEKFLMEKTHKKCSNDLFEEELKDDIEEFIKKIDKEYDTNFLNDDSFRESILCHLIFLINRQQNQISFSNPLVKEISIRYPAIFDLAIRFSRILEGKYNISISHHEIGFIATHFAAHIEKEICEMLSSYSKIAIVCSSGRGSALLMKLKLEILFSSSDIRIFSIFDEDEVVKFAPDIIFTNCEVKRAVHVPVIHINEIIDDIDLLKIKNIIKNSNGTVDISEHNKEFIKLFKKNAFRIVTSETEYLSLLSNMSQDIEKLGYSTENYSKYVMEREIYMSTVYDNGVAIPHPINMCGIEDVISVAIIKNNLKRDDKDIKIIFMISLKKGNLNRYSIITKTLFEIMNDKKIISKLRSSDNFEEFLINLKELDL